MTPRPLPIYFIRLTLLLVTLGSSTYLPSAALSYHPTYLKFALLQTATIVLALRWAVEATRPSGPRPQPVCVEDRTFLALSPVPLLLLYVLLTLLSTLWSESRALTAMSCMPLLFYASWALLLAARVRALESVPPIAQTLVLAGVLAALVGLATYFAGIAAQPDRLFYAGYRLMRPFGNPTFMAAFLLVPMFISAAHVPVSSGWRLWAYAAGLGLMFLALAFTRSESGLVGLIAGTSAYAFLLLRPWIRSHRAVAIGALGLPLIAVLACAPLWWPHVMNAAFNPQSTLHVRAFLWQSAWAMFKEHPLLGWGHGAFISNAYRFLPPEAHLYPYIGIGAPLSGLINHAHSEFVEIAVETGILGLILFLLFVVAVLARAIRFTCTTDDVRLRAIGLGLTAGVVGMLVESAGDVALRFWDVAPFFWTGLSLLMAIGNPVPAPRPAATAATSATLHPPARLALLVVVATLLWAFTCFRPYESQARLAKAEGFAKRGKDQDAAPLYQRAIATSLYHVDYIRTHLLLGTCLARLQRYDQAAAVLEKLQTLAPNYHRSRLYLGDVYLRLGRVSAAMFCLEAYRRQNPYDPLVYLRLAIGHREMNQPDHAEEMLQKGLKLAPHNVTLQQELEAIRNAR